MIEQIGYLLITFLVAVLCYIIFGQRDTIDHNELLLKLHSRNPDLYFSLLEEPK
jgi:hypothetical protein